MIENTIRLDDPRIPVATNLDGMVTHGMQDGQTKQVPTELIYAAAQDAAQVALYAAQEADDARESIEGDLAEKIEAEEYSLVDYGEI